MKVKGLNGRTYNLKVSDYAIDWSRKVSGPQKAVKDFLRPFWAHHVICEELPVPTGRGRPVRFDLVNLTRKVIVEVSPQSSHSFNRFFHKSRVGFGAAVKRDLDKEAWATANGFTFVEITDADMPLLSAEWFQSTYGITL